MNIKELTVLCERSKRLIKSNLENVRFCSHKNSLLLVVKNGKGDRLFFTFDYDDERGLFQFWVDERFKRGSKIDFYTKKYYVIADLFSEIKRV